MGFRIEVGGVGVWALGLEDSDPIHAGHELPSPASQVGIIAFNMKSGASGKPSRFPLMAHRQRATIADHCWRLLHHLERQVQLSNAISRFFFRHQNNNEHPSGLQTELTRALHMAQEILAEHVFIDMQSAELV